MDEFEWYTNTNWSVKTWELRRREPETGTGYVFGWLNQKDVGVFEYTHATHEIGYVLPIHVGTLEEAKQIAETAVKLKVDL